MKRTSFLAGVVFTSLGTICHSSAVDPKGPDSSEQISEDEEMGIPSYGDLFKVIQDRIHELEKGKKPINPREFRNFYLEFPFKGVTYDIAMEYGALAVKIARMKDFEREKLIKKSEKAKGITIHFNNWDPSTQRVSETKNMLSIFYPLKVPDFPRAGIVLSFDKSHKLKCQTIKEPRQLKSNGIDPWINYEAHYKTPNDVRIKCRDDEARKSEE